MIYDDLVEEMNFDPLGGLKVGKQTPAQRRRDLKKIRRDQGKVMGS